MDGVRDLVAQVSKLALDPTSNDDSCTLNSATSSLVGGANVSTSTRRQRTGGGFLPHIPSGHKPISLTARVPSRNGRGMHGRQDPFDQKFLKQNFRENTLVWLNLPSKLKGNYPQCIFCTNCGDTKLGSWFIFLSRSPSRLLRLWPHPSSTDSIHDTQLTCSISDNAGTLSLFV